MQREATLSRIYKTQVETSKTFILLSLPFMLLLPFSQLLPFPLSLPFLLLLSFLQSLSFFDIAPFLISIPISLLLPFLLSLQTYTNNQPITLEKKKWKWVILNKKPQSAQIDN